MREGAAGGLCSTLTPELRVLVAHSYRRSPQIAPGQDLGVDTGPEVQTQPEVTPDLQLSAEGPQNLSPMNAFAMQQGFGNSFLQAQVALSQGAGYEGAGMGGDGDGGFASATPGGSGGGGAGGDTPAGAAFSQATSGGGGEVPYRSQMESFFGTDFSGVQAHLGASNGLSSLGADGAAVGETVAFRESNPSPGLVAHELTHVVQSRGGSSGAVAGSGAEGVGTTDPAGSVEREARTVAAAFTSGSAQAPSITGQFSGAVARQVPPAGTGEQPAAPSGDKGNGQQPSGGTDESPEQSEDSDSSQAKDFTPVLEVTPDLALSVLNEEVNVNGTVTNADSAPVGTSYKWSESGVVSSIIEPDTSVISDSSYSSTYTTKAVGDSPVNISVSATGQDSTELGSAQDSSSVTVESPSISWEENISGKMVGGEGELSKFQIGTSIRIDAVLSNINNAASIDGVESVVEYLEGMPGDDPIETKSGNTFSWECVPKNVGKFKLKYSISIPGAEISDSHHTVAIEIFPDIQRMKDMALEIESKTLGKYDSAIGRVDGAYGAFKAAKDSHESAVGTYEAALKFERDFYLSIFSEALKGTVSNVVGQSGKNTLSPAPKDYSTHGSIGAAQGVAKSVTGALASLGKTNIELSSNTDISFGIESAASPENWSGQLKKRLGDQKNEVRGFTRKLIKEIDNTRIDLNAGRPVDEQFVMEDPAPAVDSDPNLAQALKCPTDKLHYAKRLWQSWVSGNRNYVLDKARGGLFLPALGLVEQIESQAGGENYGLSKDEVTEAYRQGQQAKYR